MRIIMVYVISKSGKPLMPTTPRKARLLLKNGKAKCVKRTPFTIKLLYDTTEYTQPLSLGIDTGSSHIGSAVVGEDGDIVYLSQIKIRNDITDKMTQRFKYRRNRRNRKTRYRKARWLNRRNSIKKNRFSPTMRSKFHSHEKEIVFVKSILPIQYIIIETGTFDPHAMKNPDVLKNKWLYQKGTNYGFANTKAYVLSRDQYTCQKCKGKSKNDRLEVHHIQFRSNGGSDESDNLITLCEDCHRKLHKGEFSVNGGKRKSELKYATQMNSIRFQILKSHPEAVETFGFITKEHRQILGLPKEHYFDAVAIACLHNIEKYGIADCKISTSFILLKKCVNDGDYQQTKGVRSQQNIPTGKIQGFRKYDKVNYLGKNYFIKGRMSSGYAILSDIQGEKIQTEKTPKLSLMKRIGARKSWIMIEAIIQNIC